HLRGGREGATDGKGERKPGDETRRRRAQSDIPRNHRRGDVGGRGFRQDHVRAGRAERYRRRTVTRARTRPCTRGFRRLVEIGRSAATASGRDKGQGQGQQRQFGSIRESVHVVPL